jgi:YbbR domain-containing protein
MTPTLRRSWRARLLENGLWLLGSFILALFVWYAAQNQNNPVQEKIFGGRVAVRVLKDDTLLVIEPPNPVQVVVRAPRSVQDTLDTSEIIVTADLRNQPAGKYSIPLTGALATNRIGTISEILPAAVSIELVKKSEAAFNITLSPVRAPPVGFEVNNTQFSESTARVSGSEDAVKRVVGVVARADLGDQTKTITRTITLIAIDSERRAVNEVLITPVQVEAVINIQPRPGVTVLKVTPKLLTSTLPIGYVVNNYSVEPAVVAVRGDRSVIEALNGTIETDGINLQNKVGSFTQTVRLALPDGVNLTDPVNIVVSVGIEAINVTREFTNIPVTTQGLDPADYQITVQPTTVNVIVKGPLQAVNTLDIKEITVIAPLAGLSAGTSTITLQAAVAHAGLTNSSLSIPNPEVRVTIVALRPTATGAATRPPTVTPTATPTSVTPTP